MAYQTLMVSDFSGGFTDDYVNAPVNQAEVVDNLLIQDNKSLRTVYGCTVEDATNAPLIPAGNQRLGMLINYDFSDKIFYQSANRIYYRNPSAYATLQGPVDSNDPFPTASTTTRLAETQWKKHIFLTADTYETPKKIYKDSSGNYQLRTAGMPPLASDPTVTPGGAGSRSYIYGFLHHYTHTAGTEEFQDFGPVTLVEVTGTDDPSVIPNPITSIPVLANSTTESYDTTNIKIYIYRTIDGGTTLYKIGEVTNGTTSYNDNSSDTYIQDNGEVIYTEGDVLDNDPPPLCKFVHVVDNYGYYASTKEGTEYRESEIRQSHPEDPDSVPNQNTITVRDDIRGLNSVQSIPMVFCRKHIYRIEGKYDESGRGTPIAVIINDTAGCVSNNSIVQAKDFVFWAGNEQFYASDGYKVLPISQHITTRYKEMLANLSDPTTIVGKYDEKNNRIWWGVQTSASSGDIDAHWILDLNFGLTNSSPFTQRSGGTSYAPTAFTFYNDDLLRGDKRGYVFLHTEDDVTDVRVDTSVSASNWELKTIEYEYKGFATNFGTDVVRKWVPRFFVTAVNESNVTVECAAINDDGRSTRTMKLIRYRKNFTWGDEDFVWGDPEFVWNGAGLIQEGRRLPHGGLRCSYMQVQIKNGFGVITNSDTIGTSTVSGATATLDTAASSDWPSASVDYYIAFEDDGYVKEYLVTARTADTVTFLDTAGSAPNGSVKWVMRGKRKREVFNLLSYSLLYMPFSQSASMFETGQAGENG